MIDIKKAKHLWPETCHGPWMNEECEPGLVSVIIPTYNRERFLVEAMDSVRAQTYRPIELIVVDDGSTDNTPQVVEEWGQKCVDDSGFELRYFHQENKGAPTARNLGLIESKGEYLKFLDSDDLLASNAVARQVAAIRDSSADVVYGDWENTYTDGEGRVLRREPKSAGEFSDPVTDLLSMRWSAPFCYLFTRRVVRSSGGWDERMAGNQDFGFALRVALTGAPFKWIRGSIGSYRQHAKPRVSTSNRLQWATSTAIALREAESVLRSQGRLTNISKEVFGPDREVFRRYICEIKRLSPGFRPPGRLYGLLVSALGYERAEGLLEIRRRIRRALGVGHG